MAVIEYHNLITGEESRSIVRAKPVFDDAGRVEFVANTFIDAADLTTLATVLDADLPKAASPTRRRKKPEA